MTPLDYAARRRALARGRSEGGAWRPASNGTETPFLTRSGRRLIYMWQPETGDHAYLDLSTDLFLTADEADRELK